ncbi:hypothetical protein HYV49_05750 [Candidatus Pacearchaeota archaeon]|nr:hypothetical protein [Candidatus Pacearchaeota archaeon]
MAVEDVVSNLALEVGRVGLWIQAIGLVVILWIIFEIIVLINNRIKRKRLYAIEDRLERIEKKLDKFTKSKRK